MRIALLTTDNRDHCRDYASAKPYFGTAPEALLQGFALLPEVEIHVVSCTQRPLFAPEKIAPNIFFHSLVVPKMGWMRTGYQGCIRAVRKKLQEIQPDLVHGQGTERDCAISAIYSGFPNVLTIHGNMRKIAHANHATPFSFLWLAARLERFTLPRTGGVVCITNYTRASVADLARQTWVLPNAVDASFFDVVAASDLSETPVGLCVGTICPLKNQNALIRSLDALAQVKKFKIIFLGQTNSSAYSTEFLQLVAARPWCEYGGFADRNRLKEYFQRAAFLALPTLEDNCPMTVLEAMAAGVPVFASKVGGVPDLIEDGETGLFCDPQKPESFSHALTRLLDDPTFAQKLAAQARAAAHNRFHPHVVAQRHLEIYHEVLAKNKSPKLQG